MRQLSRIFMVLSALCFAVPAFAQGGAAALPRREHREGVHPDHLLRRLEAGDAPLGEPGLELPRADRVARRLVRSGWSATQIHGDRSQSQRNSAIRSFSEGHHRVLVATDVAARGIDVAHVAHVVNYDLPKQAEDFVHRVGRTGRASAKGIASTFAGASERGELKKIERTLSIQMKRFRVRSQQGTAA